MKDYSEIIRILKDQITCTRRKVENMCNRDCDYCRLAISSASYIQVLEEAVEALQNEENDGWNPVSLRLPEVDDEVNNWSDVCLVTVHDDSISDTTTEYLDLAIYDHNYCCWKWANGPVTAWRPTPEPYDGGENE